MGVLKRQTLTRSCDAARADLGELLDEEADDQLGLGGEGQFFLARWRRELQGTRKSATSVGGWSTGGARAHAHQPLHPLGSVLALLLLVHHGLVVQMFRMVRPCWYLASRDIVRLLPSRAGGERRERGAVKFRQCSVCTTSLAAALPRGGTRRERGSRE